MNFRNYIFLIATGIVFFLSGCNNDDDNTIEVTPPRDRGEQQESDESTLQEYLKTHYFREVPNSANPEVYNTIVFDTLTPDAPAGVTSIWDSGLLKTKEVISNDVSYTLYILGFTEPDPERQKPTFADSVFVTYRGESLYNYRDKDGDGINDDADVDADDDGEPEVDTINDMQVTRTDSDGDGISDAADVDNNDGQPDSDGDGIIDEKDEVDNADVNSRVFDSAVNPVWFDLLNVVQGFREAATEFTPSSGFTQNPDGTIMYNNDFGNFVVFMPSGLAYFNAPPQGSGIRTYVPLIFQVQLYQANEADHDQDGVPSYLEDIDKDGLVFDEGDDTDGDNIPNYLDTDDDGDGTRTIDEDLEPDMDLTVDRDGDGDPTNDIGDGDPTNDDSDNDGIPNYLDADNTASRTDT